MDILRKMFKMTQEEEEANRLKNKDTPSKDAFRKPQWFEESETDDELFDDDRKFAFQIFTNPMELQKHFEHQMQQILEAVSEFEDNVQVEKNLKEEYLKPGFEGNLLKEFEKQKKDLFDTDLDGEIYADQLHSIIQRLTPPEVHGAGILPRNDNKANRMLKPKQKLSDEETILGKIHGTLVDEESRMRLPRQRPDIMAPPPMMPRGVTPFGGVFEGTYQGPKMFRQSVMTKTVRKPDGTFETTKITTDSDGNKTTSVTRTINGKTETITTYDGAAGGALTPGNKGGMSQTIPFVGSNEENELQQQQQQIYSDRNIYVTKKGYAVPRNLW